MTFDCIWFWKITNHVTVWTHSFFFFVAASVKYHLFCLFHPNLSYSVTSSGILIDSFRLLVFSPSSMSHVLMWNLPSVLSTRSSMKYEVEQYHRQSIASTPYKDPFGEWVISTVRNLPNDTPRIFLNFVNKDIMGVFFSRNLFKSKSSTNLYSITFLAIPLYFLKNMKEK